MKKLFEFNADEILKVSAKTGVGVLQLLDNIIDKIPPPTSESSSNHLKAVVFDLWYEKFKGIVLLVRVLNGNIELGNQIIFSTSPHIPHTVREVNALRPNQIPISGKPPTLHAGQVGVIVANIHDYDNISIGDLIYLNNEHGLECIKFEKLSKTKSLKSNPMIYASIYPCEASNFLDLQKSLQKLLLNDCSVRMSKETHPALGNGFK